MLDCNATPSFISHLGLTPTSPPTAGSVLDRAAYWWETNDGVALKSHVSLSLSLYIYIYIYTYAYIYIYIYIYIYR